MEFLQFRTSGDDVKFVEFLYLWMEFLQLLHPPS